MDTSIFSDPVRFGPGVWFSLHIDAINALTESLKLAFEIKVNTLCDNFKCKICVPHFRHFIDTHPLRTYWHLYNNKGQDIGFFKWTWELHNQVNKRLNKSEPSFEQAYNYYSNPEVGACFNCISTQEELRSIAIPPILTVLRPPSNIGVPGFKIISRESS